jgi:hypothetical protein
VTPRPVRLRLPHFDTSGGQLDQPLHEFGHSTLLTRGNPEPLPLLVSLPVISMIKEVQTGKVRPRCPPLTRIESWRNLLR